ncbi:MAG TPA: carbohydrate binding domain-containing protein, partial [Pyrinomonadaceae bacterium]|nr:carbohydrate binding domain-containing protein [Pyrinomonadaceae bacterium]
AGLAKFYAGKGRAEDSLRVWNTLSEEEKQANASGARIIAQALYEKGFLRSALEFVRQLGIEPDAKAETFQNGGFEKPIGEAKDVYFGWQVSPVEKIDVKLDPTQKFEGNRSLRVTFSGYAQPTLYAIYQIITVEPKTKYRLSFRLRTENLKSGGAPNLEIFDSNGSKNIAFSPPFPAGTSDWQLVKIEFTAPENAEAVGIRTTRVFCGADCPIVGTFWYDDFKLERPK